MVIAKLFVLISHAASWLLRLRQVYRGTVSPHPPLHPPLISTTRIVFAALADPAGISHFACSIHKDTHARHYVAVAVAVDVAFDVAVAYYGARILQLQSSSSSSL